MTKDAVVPVKAGAGIALCASNSLGLAKELICRKAEVVTKEPNHTLNVHVCGPKTNKINMAVSTTLITRYLPPLEPVHHAESNPVEYKHKTSPRNLDASSDKEPEHT